MFTLYIHCLEVLAMHYEGATVSRIAEMGCEYSSKSIVSALRELHTEGFVTMDRSGKITVYQVTEKAIEYCETVSRKYAQSHVLDEISDYVASSNHDETEEVKVIEPVEEVKPTVARKLWTPRKTLVVMAADNAKRNGLTAYIAIEETIQFWQQVNINQKSRDYYAGLSHQAQLRLITDVKNELRKWGV